MITTYILVFMSYAGPVNLGRYTDQGLCQAVALNEGARCVIAVEKQD